MTWVLLISLGPVQDFIVTARKCQDLWYGSWLLSELAGATAAALRGALGESAMVFPSGAAGGEASTELPREVANKILVVVEGDAARVRAAADGAREAMTTRLRERRDEVFETVGKGDPSRSEHFKIEAAKAQVEELIEFFWVAAPVEPHGYAAARDEAERLLAARKNTRLWTQAPWAAPVPKSSLDGLRESVIDESVYGPKGVPPAERLRWYGTDRAERLSGIDVLKRKGFDGLFPAKRAAGAHRDWHRKRGRWRFASTQHLASLPWMIRVDAAAQAQPKGEIARAWGEYCDRLDALSPGLLERYAVAPQKDEGWLFGDVDGTLLQENGLADAVREFSPENGPGEATVKEAEKARKDFLGEVRASMSEPPPPEVQPYYAILLADGDRMGAVIDHAKTRAEHQAISAALAGFAERVGGIVRDSHKGSLVYSGGDDVLALLPIHTALACADELHSEFGRAMGSFFDEKGVSPTLSAGLVFAHQKTPLFESLAMVRLAEKAAKRVDGKDALAFWVDKRGGERVEVRGRFTEVVDDLRRLTGFRRRGEVPGKAAYELDELVTLRIDPLPDDTAEAKRVRAAMAGVQVAEIQRVLTRRRSEGSGGAMPEGARTWLQRRAEALSEGGNPAEALSLRLRVAEAIARGEDEAGMALPEETR